MLSKIKQQNEKVVLDKKVSNKYKHKMAEVEDYRWNFIIVLPFLAFVTTLVEMNVNGFNMILVCRRHLSAVINSSGLWLDTLQKLSYWLI